MVLYFSIIFLLYYLLVLLFIIGWKKSSKAQTIQNLPKDKYASIIVAVRNEAKNISGLLQSLSIQVYPSDLFEVIIVDDHSEDETVQIVEEFKRSSKINLELLRNESQIERLTSAKKAALERGIAAADGEIIVATDGDCWMSENWLKSMVAPFSNEEVKLVSGPVAIDPGSSLFSKIQALEFSSLMGSGAALINLSYPLMCNGANLAFRKSAFREVDGYNDVDHHASGDDVYLMQKIHKSFSQSIIFNHSKEALVYTSPEKSMKSLIGQRRRWASKWNTYALPFSWAIPVFLFLHYLSFLGLLTMPFFIPSFLLFSVVLLAAKFILDLILLKKAAKFCNLSISLTVFVLAEFLYPFYAIFIGILVHFGEWSWKGRNHKT